MHIGLNLLYLRPRVVGGTETYASGLLHALAKIDTSNSYSVFVSQEGKSWPIPRSSNFRRVVCEVSATNRGRRYLFEQIKLPRLVRKLGIDVLHSLGYVSPLRVDCSSVVTIHDLNFIGFGDQMSPMKRLALKLFVSSSVKRADFIITVSENSRSEIIYTFHPPAEKIVVTYEASRIVNESEDHVHASAHDDPYIIAFSSISPNKNIPNLLRAYAMARNRGLRHRLVLVGHQPPGGELATLSRDLCLGNSVEFAGYLEDVALRNTLRGATLLVFPSIYEGFGLPVLEAMCLGVPVACSNRASLPEVGGTAALYFDPLSEKDMSDKIYSLASDSQMQEKLRREGFVNAARFSWEMTARGTLGVYERAAFVKRPVDRPS